MTQSPFAAQHPLSAARSWGDSWPMPDLAAPVTTPTPPPPGRRSSGCLRAIVLLGLAFLVTVAFVAWRFETFVKEGTGWWAALFKNAVSQNLTENFRQSVTEISSTNGDILEVAVMRTDETVTRHDSKALLNHSIPLGITTSEIRTPVVFRYHIKLSDPWQVEIQGRRCVVRAPMIRPSLPPAIETQGMEKRSEAGWFRFNAAENLAQLEKDLTPTLQQRAGNKHHIDLVREPSRKSIAAFVQNWLLKQDQGTRAQIDSIVVLFPDETTPASDVPATAPSLQLPQP